MSDSRFYWTENLHGHCRWIVLLWSAYSNSLPTNNGTTKTAPVPALHQFYRFQGGKLSKVLPLQYMIPSACLLVGTKRKDGIHASRYPGSLGFDRANASLKYTPISLFPCKTPCMLVRVPSWKHVRNIT
jgi:hypothetical protein